MPHPLSNRLRAALQSRLLRNMGWSAAAEAMIRVSRLLTAVILARFLMPEDYGLAAIALTTNELVKVLTNTGFGQRIVRATDDELGAVCNTAWRLNWLVCGGLFILQSLVAAPVAWFYGEPRLAWMIAGLGLVYLMMPFGLVQCFLVMRDNRLKINALVSGAQVTCDNLLTAALAVMGLGPWAVVLPKVIVGPIWVIGMRRARCWQPTPEAGLTHWRDFVGYGRAILGTEIVKTLRLYADRLIIGAALGVEAVGVYYFAFSAGLGISMAFVAAFTLALFPHLCESLSDPAALRRRWTGAVGLCAAVVIPLIGLQAALAPWYVPLVFGERWAGAVPVLALLCLSALPRPFAEGAGQLLRAVGRPEVEMRFNMAFTALYMAAVGIGLPFGLTGVAGAVLAVHLIVLPPYTWWVARTVLPRPTPSPAPAPASAPATLETAS